MGSRKKKDKLAFPWSVRAVLLAGLCGAFFFFLGAYRGSQAGGRVASLKAGLQNAVANVLPAKGVAAAAARQVVAEGGEAVAAPPPVKQAFGHRTRQSGVKQPPAADASRRPALPKGDGVHWVVVIDCVEDKGASCDAACADQGLECNTEAMQPLTSWNTVKAAFLKAGMECDGRVEIDIAGAWDGPHVNGAECAYSTNSNFEPTCERAPSCGWSRLCACVKGTETAQAPMKFRTIKQRPLLWYEIPSQVPAPIVGDWISETKFLDGLLRSFGKLRADYNGPQKLRGFREGGHQLFDEQGLFAFDKSIRSVAFDVGAANNPLDFDTNIDDSQVGIFVEPLQWKTIEDDLLRSAESWHSRSGGCDKQWAPVCSSERTLVFPAACSSKLGHETFHVTANPYCGSLEAFTRDNLDPSLVNNKDPEVRGILKACYEDAGKTRTVATVSLKAIIERIPKHIRIKYMKIDAQGHDFKVFLSAGDQISRIEYVRFEMQVDPPPGRKLVKDVPPYVEVVAKLKELGFKYEGAHACHFDAGASTFSREVREMECVFCQNPPCREGGRPPLGPRPDSQIQARAQIAYERPRPWEPGEKETRDQHDDTETSRAESEEPAPSSEHAPSVEAEEPGGPAALAADTEEADAPPEKKVVYKPPGPMPPIGSWSGIVPHLPRPEKGDWMSETQFLERVLRSYGKQRIGYSGFQRMDGLQPGKIFDDDGMFAFDKKIKSVAIDVGAANNPLSFDLPIDSSQVAFFVEPLQWKTLEQAVETDSHALRKRGGAGACVRGFWDGFCVMNRFYVFPAAVSNELGHAKFHATANPYCGSLETFSASNKIDPELVNSKNPEIRSVFQGCYKDLGFPGQVPTISLKAIIERIPKHIRIKYVKIDAQGHDYKVLLSAGDQMSRIEYARFEMQVDPPPGRKLVHDIPSYAEIEKHLTSLGFKHKAPHACYFDHGASPFSKAVKEMECVFCRKLPCREGGVPPLGENPQDVVARNQKAWLAEQKKEKR